MVSDLLDILNEVQLLYVLILDRLFQFLQLSLELLLIDGRSGLRFCLLLDQLQLLLQHIDLCDKILIGLRVHFVDFLED